VTFLVGAALASGAGPRTTEAVAKKKVAVVAIGIACCEGTKTMAKGVQDAAKAHGWTSQLYDGRGDPANAGQALKQIAAQKSADAVALLDIDASLVSDGVAALNRANIPVITSHAGVVFRGVLADVGHNDFRQAAGAADILVQKLNRKGEVALFKWQGLTGVRKRTTVAQAALGFFPDVKIVATHEINIADMINDVQKATAAMLTAHPKITGIFFPFDTGLPGLFAGLKQVRKSGQVRVVSMDGLPIGLKAVKDGSLVGNAGIPFDFQGWQVVDLLHRHFAKTSLRSNPFGLDGPVFSTDTIPITRANVAKVTAKNGTLNNNLLYPNYKSVFRRAWSAG
jgi:ABC-type sugar transport system substrate-binding protein